MKALFASNVSGCVRCGARQHGSDPTSPLLWLSLFQLSDSAEVPAHITGQESQPEIEDKV